jgi:hypothetical protein
MAKVESTTITMTAACEIFGRHANHQGPGACSGRILSFTEANLTDCTCSCHDTDVPADEEDGGLDTYVDLMIERELEDLHFAEGWS